MRTIDSTTCAVLAAVASAVGVTSAVAHTPPPYPQGEARIVSDARLLSADRVRVKVTCTGAPAWTACRGRVRLRSRGLVVTRRHGRRKIVPIAGGELAALRPGESVELVMPVTSQARYHLRRRRVTKATGFIDNALCATGSMRTTRTALEVRR